MVAVLFTPETAGEPLPGTQPSAASNEEARDMASDVRKDQGGGQQSGQE